MEMLSCVEEQEIGGIFVWERQKRESFSTTFVQGIETMKIYHVAAWLVAWGF
jgi:hypothetical protein